MILQAGLIEKWKLMFWERDDECSATARGGQGGTTFVTVSDMQGSFFILFIGKDRVYVQSRRCVSSFYPGFFSLGCFMALMVILCEFIAWRNKSERKNASLIKPFVA